MNHRHVVLSLGISCRESRANRDTSATASRSNVDRSTDVMII